ncbi:MAG TPA: hypothetical protein VMH87_12045 [Pseudomonadales bacterium]|nr:hypothetical protein [Pseudomonadales bacterium]
MKIPILKTIGFAALMLFGLLLIGCNYERDSHSFTSRDLEMIQTNIGVAIPAGSSGLNMYYQDFHAALHAKIQIPPESAQTLVDQIKRIPAEDIHDIESSTNKWPWWTPTKPDVIIDKEFTRKPDGDFIHLILCKEKDDGLWILYVEWATM